MVTGLPVAGVEGSLRRRFGDDASLAGRGVVRGKTGTLREVHTLAGLLRTRDGSVLVYAFLINNPKNRTTPGSGWTGSPPPSAPAAAADLTASPRSFGRIRSKLRLGSVRAGRIRSTAWQPR